MIVTRVQPAQISSQPGGSALLREIYTQDRRRTHGQSQIVRLCRPASLRKVPQHSPLQMCEDLFRWQRGQQRPRVVEPICWLELTTPSGLGSDAERRERRVRTARQGADFTEGPAGVAPGSSHPAIGRRSKCVQRSSRVGTHSESCVGRRGYGRRTFTRSGMDHNSVPECKRIHTTGDSRSGVLLVHTVDESKGGLCVGPLNR